MTKVNLNDFVTEESDVIVFNNGNAGRVKNVRVEVSKKLPTDTPNSPDIKFNFYDEQQGVVNLGVYYPTERTKDSEIHIRINQMVSILHSLAPATKNEKFPEFDTNTQAYEFLAQQIAKYSRDGRVNVFVTYGTTTKPSKYLTFRAYNIVEPVDTPDEKTRLVPSTKERYVDQMTRPQPTNFDSILSSLLQNNRLTIF